MTTIPRRGDLRDYNIARILIGLNRERATGTLSVATSLFTKKTYLKDGNVIFASSSFEDDRLGEMLVKAGKISMEQYDKSVELLKTTGKRQGAILVDLGYITPKDLFWGVKYQVKEIIYSLFQIEEGTYEFIGGALPLDEVITLKIGMENLIYEGVQRITNWTRIRRELPDVNTVFSLNEDPSGIFKGIDLRSQDRTILSLVDGRRTMNQLIEEARMNSFDVMKTLYVLWSAGFIVEKKVSVQEESVTATGEETERSVMEEQEELRRKVEDFYEKLGNMTEAEILQIVEDSDSEEVKRNYYRLVKEFHPDLLYNSPDEALKKKMNAVFDAVTKAFNLLKDDTKRKDFFNSLGRLRKEEDTDAALLEEQFMRGIEEFKNGNFWGASELFRLVTRRSPKNTRAWSYLSLALSKMPNRLKEAEEAILEAIRLDPFNSEHLSNLGLLYLKAGLKKRAEHQFLKALRLDPDNAKARKGLEQAK